MIALSVLFRYADLSFILFKHPELMAKFDNDIVSPSTPRMGNALTRWVGQTILDGLGWRLSGELPDEKKIIIVGAPHTSNWDLIIAMACVLAVGLKFNWMMKKEAFIWPFGALWRSLGGIPIDRSQKNDVVGQITEWFEKEDQLWLGITPEGTRTKVDAYKKGYLRIAYATKAPIFIIGIKADTKEIVLDKQWPLTFDIEQDNRKIKAYFDETFVGIRSENS